MIFTSRWKIVTLLNTVLLSSHVNAADLVSRDVIALGTRSAANESYQDTPPYAEPQPQTIAASAPDMLLDNSSPIIDRWIIDGELLYWKATAGGLEYLSSVAVPVFLPTSGSLTETSASFVPAFRWDPGFRVGFGYQGDTWNHTLTWTRFNNHARGATSGDPSANLQYVLGLRTFNTANTGSSSSSTLGFTVDSYSSHVKWKLYYNTLDWVMSMALPVQKRFLVDPFLGLRAAWIHQNFSNNAQFLNVSVTNFQGNQPVVFPAYPGNSTESATNRFSGGGLYAGVDGTFYLGEGFSLLVRAAGSLIIGKFHVSDTVTVNGNNPQGGPSSTASVINSHFFRIKPNLEGSFGLQYAVTFESQQRLIIRADYQLVQWFGQNQLPGLLFTRPFADNDLNIQGVRLAISAEL